MQDANKYHLAKRDLFLLQSAKEKMLETKAASNDPEIIKNCEEYLEKLDGGIQETLDIIDGYQTEGIYLSSSTYDDMNVYLYQKNENLDMEIHPQMEAKVSEVRSDLMQQIEKNLYKSIDKRDIDITENLKTVYEADVFSQLELLTNGVEIPKIDLRTPLMDFGFNHAENKEKIDLFPKLRIEKIGDEYVFCEPLEEAKEKLSVSLEKVSAQLTKGFER